MCFLQKCNSLSWDGLTRCCPDVAGDGKHLPLGSQVSSSCWWGNEGSVPGRGGWGLEQHPSVTMAHTEAETHPHILRERLNIQESPTSFSNIQHPWTTRFR